MDNLKLIQEEIETEVMNNDYSLSLEQWRDILNETMIKYINNGSIYNYYVKCDEENNIYLDKDIKIVDIYVEPIKEKGIFVNQITITKTGEINPGGYSSL
jgi:hypothetical protein